MRKKIKNYSGRDFSKTRDNDKLTRKKRSNLMSKIRSKNTKFELAFAQELRKRTRFKFATNVSSLLGKPDIVFEEQRVCVFLDSDFWHGWQYPRWSHLLKDDFWRRKIVRNRTRDKAVSRRLRRAGWRVIRYWEHNITKEKQGVALSDLLQRLFPKTMHKYRARKKQDS